VSTHMLANCTFSFQLEQTVASMVWFVSNTWLVKKLFLLSQKVNSAWLAQNLARFTVTLVKFANFWMQIPLFRTYGRFLSNGI
jgi:hypothetical protein